MNKIILILFLALSGAQCFADGVMVAMDPTGKPGNEGTNTSGTTYTTNNFTVQGNLKVIGTITGNGTTPAHIPYPFPIVFIPMQGNVDLVTGVNVCNQRPAPYAGTINRVTINAKVGPVGADLIIDIRKNGTTIWSTTANRIKLTAGGGGALQSTTTFNTTTFSQDDLFTCDVIQVGTTTAGQGVTVTIDTTINP